MIRLRKEQIILMHQELINATGSIHGVRDEGLLDSALAASYTGYGEEEFFPSIEEKAARLAVGLVNNHPMIDGNKRIGAHAMLTLLVLNKVKLLFTQKELSDEFLAIANGKHQYEDLLQWIKEHEQSD